MRYKVTIVIPIYNVAPYIERCLESAFRQSFESIQYLLIDDQGSDNSIILAREIARKSNRTNDIFFLNHPCNIGLGGTRNTGIKKAAGEFIYFMDSDDEIPFDAIEKLYNSNKVFNAEIVVGSYTSVDYTQTGVKWEWIFENNNIIGDFNVSSYYLKGGYYVMTWNKLYNTNFLRKNNIFCDEHSNHEDIFFSIQAALSATSLLTVSDITYYYSFRNGSIMNIFLEKNFLDYISSIKLLTEYARKYSVSPIFSRLVYYIYGFRFSVLEKINGSNHLKLIIRKNLSKNITRIPFLSLIEIWTLKGASLLHKIKYSISYLPYNIQLFLLKIINTIYSK